MNDIDLNLIKKKSLTDWNKFLNPESLKTNLIQTSLFIAAYEILRSCIVDKVKGFYAHEYYFDDSSGHLKSKTNKEYKDKVLDLYPKDEFHACCLWFSKNGVLNQDDIDTIARIRHHRNSITHEMISFISNTSKNVDELHLELLRLIIRKVELWWIREVEIPANPEFDEVDLDSINWDEVYGGSQLMLDIILNP